MGIIYKVREVAFRIFLNMEYRADLKTGTGRNTMPTSGLQGILTNIMGLTGILIIRVVQDTQGFQQTINYAIHVGGNGQCFQSVFCGIKK